MKPIKPIQFKQNDREKVLNQKSEPMQAAPKSTDPVNFPVFSIPVGKKVLVYVPNHTMLDEEGNTVLRVDEVWRHSLTVGKRYLSIRCTFGKEMPEYGLDGSCPCCENKDDPWTLANLIIDAKCKAQGLSKDDTEDPTVKAIRSAAYSDRKLKEANRYFTFPIVVFETLNDDGKTLIKDEEMGYKCKPYWYSCSDKIWQDKWKKALESMEDEPTHPGGYFFLLNYIYTPKNGKQQNARDAARELTISARRIQNSENLRKRLDALTEEWTPAKSSEVVIDNQFYPVETVSELVDECLEPTRRLIDIYTANEEGGAAGLPGGNSGFALEKADDADKDEEPVTLPVGGMPLETDMDVE